VVELLSESANDRRRFAALALEVHERVVEAAHNRAMAAQFGALRGFLENAYLGVAKQPEIRARVIIAHGELVELIARRDAEGARHHMEARLSEFIARTMPAAVKRPAAKAISKK
jgi:DNA-binding FadR family transcriptional regulator